MLSNHFYLYSYHCIQISATFNIHTKIKFLHEFGLYYETSGTIIDKGPS